MTGRPFGFAFLAPVSLAPVALALASLAACGHGARPPLPPPIVAAVTDQDVRGAGLDGELLEQHAHVREVATLAGMVLRAGWAASTTTPGDGVHLVGDRPGPLP